MGLQWNLAPSSVGNGHTGASWSDAASPLLPLTNVDGSIKFEQLCTFSVGREPEPPLRKSKPDGVDPQSTITLSKETQLPVFRSCPHPVGCLSECTDVYDWLAAQPLFLNYTSEAKFEASCAESGDTPGNNEFHREVL